jgi:hypothetical protein
VPHGGHSPDARFPAAARWAPDWAGDAWLRVFVVRTGRMQTRPSMVSAKVPCTSSQARTQREQTMHFVGSKVK